MFVCTVSSTAISSELEWF